MRRVFGAAAIASDCRRQRFWARFLVDRVLFVRLWRVVHFGSKKVYLAEVCCVVLVKLYGGVTDWPLARQDAQLV